MTCCVYVIRNVTNGKAYVGKTKFTAQERWNGHVYSAMHGSPYAFHGAIRKHGVDAFIVSTIAEGLEAAMANDLEIASVAKFDSMIDAHGYNMTPGGDGVPWTPEIGAKMSASRSGSGNPMYGRCGALNPMYGKRTSVEVAAKISRGVKRTREINGPIMITDRTRQNMVNSKTKQFAHIVPLHVRVCELRANGMKYKDIARVIEQELGLVKSPKGFAVIVSDHNLQRCRTCRKMGVL